MNQGNNARRSQKSKIPPHNKEAEMSVLGAMLLDKEAIATVLEVLKPSDMYFEENQRIFEAIMGLFETGHPIDVVTISETLAKEGILEKVGGIEKLTYLMSMVPSSTNVRHYSNIVKEKAVLRKLISTSNDIMDMSYQGSDQLNTILDRAEKGIFDLLQDQDTEGYSHIGDVVERALKQLEELAKQDGSITGIPSGLTLLDAKLSGFQNSDLILVAARPGMGKTSLALNFMQHAAIRKNVPTAIFSLEMSKEQLVNRIICSEAMIDSNKVKTGNLNPDEWNKIAEVIGPIASSPIYIDDTPGTNVMEIRAKCRKLKLEHNLGLVMIDYLQLMSGSKRADNRQQEIAEMSRALKIMAKELNVPVICLSQLSRASEIRANHRPILSDLRESGAIEQDADIVMFIYRETGEHDDDKPSNNAEINVAKHRSGSTGIIEVLWLGEYTKFVNKESVQDA